MKVHDNIDGYNVTILNNVNTANSRNTSVNNALVILILVRNRKTQAVHASNNTYNKAKSYQTSISISNSRIGSGSG